MLQLFIRRNIRGLGKRPLILLSAQRLCWAENRQKNSSQKSISGWWCTLKFSCCAKPQVFARMPPLVRAAIIPQALRDARSANAALRAEAQAFLADEVE